MPGEESLNRTAGMPTGNHCLFGLKVPLRFSDRVPEARFQLFGD